MASVKEPADVHVEPGFTDMDNAPVRMYVDSRANVKDSV